VRLQTCLLMVFVLLGLAGHAMGDQGWQDEAEVHGFLEQRAGSRTVDDPYQEGLSIMETRFQLDGSYAPDWGQLRLKADTLIDGVEGTGRCLLRELNLQLSPLSQVDIKVGRQALTWGTGDLLFINDMFPKDWVSFFIGRDLEYLKAPSDAIKINSFLGRWNLTLVYTPQFDPDMYIDGSRISYWNGYLGRIAGKDAIIKADRPDKWFSDDEWAVRFAGRVGRYDLALYGYWGYWKSPGGIDPTTGMATFPRLDVYGASIEGPFAKGLGNIELGWYRSVHDLDGYDPTVNNSELRYLVGYRQEIWRDLNAGMQYYIEQILDYDGYMAGVPSEMARDRIRQVLTANISSLWMNQNLVCSFFLYYSPSDEDAYLRPNIRLKASDHMTFDLGANIFTGPQRHTFFGQFRYDTNIYAGLRLSF